MSQLERSAGSSEASRARSRGGLSLPWALALVWLILGSVAVRAEAERVRATVNRDEVTLEDQIQLTITIEGSRSARPTLPDLADFEVYARGSSTQMSFVNGRASSSVSYNYVLVPKRAGSFTIGPATAEVDGGVHASRPLTIRVLTPSEEPRQSRDLFLTAKVSTTRPYVGQQVVYIWRFYRRVGIADARLEPQDFSGFLAEELGDVREYQATVNGVEYLVSEIRKALFPQEVGQATIPASRLTCEVAVASQRRSRSVFDGFFGPTATETKVLRTREIELDVQPLPEPPQGFSGLIGDFAIDARIGATELGVGESTTLRLTVAGSGNAQMISEPSLPELPQFKIYGDKPSGTLDRAGTSLSGSRTYSKALVPLVPGALEIPPAEVVYFDPEEGIFRTAATDPIALQVRPASGEEELRLTESLAPGTGKVAVRILADDILPIYKDLAVVRSAGAHGSHPVLLGAGLAVPPMVFAATVLVGRRRRRFQSDATLRRRRDASRRARKALRRLAGLEPAEAYEAGSRCVREFVGDKLGLEGLALTPPEVEECLREQGVDEDLVRDTRRFLEGAEASRYGALEADAGSVSNAVSSLLKRLERQIQA